MRRKRERDVAETQIFRVAWSGVLLPATFQKPSRQMTEQLLGGEKRKKEKRKKKG